MADKELTITEKIEALKKGLQSIGWDLIKQQTGEHDFRFYNHNDSPIEIYISGTFIKFNETDVFGSSIFGSIVISLKDIEVETDIEDEAVHLMFTGNSFISFYNFN